MGAEQHPDLAEGTLTAYEVFAGFYDDFTSDHNFYAWTMSLEGLARSTGVARGRLLDVGCGTGKSFVPMLERGWSVTGVDRSPAMLRQAQARATDGVDLSCADVRALPDLGQFELVWSLGDLVNYLEPAELVPVFRGLRRQLADGGGLLFDASTAGQFTTLYASLLVEQKAGDVFVLDGQGWIDDERRTAEIWIDRLRQDLDGWWSRERSIHRHRYHRPDEVCAAMRAAGLHPLGIWGNAMDGTISPSLDERRDVKAIFVATRASDDALQ